MIEEYDLILIQPPLLKKEIECVNNDIEKRYWKTMYKKGGILLGDSPFEGSYPILTIGTYLKKRGYSIKIIDFHLMDLCSRYELDKELSKNDIIDEIKKYKSKFYGITVMTISKEISNEISNIIRSINNDPYIFWGGYYPTNNYETILKANKNINFIVRNEGEIVIEKILRYYKNNSRLYVKNINSLSFCCDEGIFCTPDELDEFNLDNIEYIDYSLYANKYMGIVIPRVYTTRGCENNRIHCTANNSIERKFRRRNIKNVVDEIEIISKKFKKKFFVMGDLEFLMNTEYSLEICLEIIKRKLDIKWWCQVYPKKIDDSILEIMKKAGNIQIALGIESKNNNLLKDLKKEVDTNESLRIIRIIKKFDIQIQAYVMIGLPRDTGDSIIDNIKFIGELVENGYIDATHLSIMTPYPGSELHKNSNKYGVEILNKSNYNYYMNCDYLGSSIPSYNTINLTDIEIYALWLFALTYLENSYRKRKGVGFSSMYKDLGIRYFFENKN